MDYHLRWTKGTFGASYVRGEKSEKDIKKEIGRGRKDREIQRERKNGIKRESVCKRVSV